jgi:hypothetical protein
MPLRKVAVAVTAVVVTAVVVMVARISVVAAIVGGISAAVRTSAVQDATSVVDRRASPSTT